MVENHIGWLLICLVLAFFSWPDFSKKHPQYSNGTILIMFLIFYFLLGELIYWGIKLMTL